MSYTLTQLIEVLDQNTIKINLLNPRNNISRTRTVTLKSGVVVGDSPVVGYIDTTTKKGMTRVSVWDINENAWVEFTFENIQSVEII